jgi:hypothetical protein
LTQNILNLFKINRNGLNIMSIIFIINILQLMSNNTENTENITTNYIDSDNESTEESMNSNDLNQFYMSELAEFFKHLMNIAPYARNATLPHGWNGWIGCGITPYLKKSKVIENDLNDEIKKNMTKDRKTFENRLIRTLQGYIEHMKKLNEDDKYQNVIERAQRLLVFVDREKDEIKLLISNHSQLFPDESESLTANLIYEEWNDKYIKEKILEH